MKSPIQTAPIRRAPSARTAVSGVSPLGSCGCPIACIGPCVFGTCVGVCV